MVEGRPSLYYFKETEKKTLNSESDHVQILMETLEKTQKELKQFIDNVSFIKETFLTAVSAVEKAQLALNDIFCEKNASSNAAEIPEPALEEKPLMLNVNDNDTTETSFNEHHLDKVHAKDINDQNKDIFGRVVSSLDRKGRFWFKPDGEENEEVTLRRFNSWQKQRHQLDENAFRVDRIVAIKERKTNSWMRGVIEKVLINKTTGKQEVRVRYLDTGELDDVSYDDVYELHDDLKCPPYLALCCCLFDNIHEDLPYEAMWLFNDLKSDKSMKLRKRKKHTIDGKNIDLVDLWSADDLADINYEVLVKVKEHIMLFKEKQSSTEVSRGQKLMRNTISEQKYQRTKNPDVLTMRIGNEKGGQKISQTQNADYCPTLPRHTGEKHLKTNADEIARLHKILLEPDPKFFLVYLTYGTLITAFKEGRLLLSRQNTIEFLDSYLDTISLSTYLIFVRWPKKNEFKASRICAVSVATSELYESNKEKNRCWVNLDFISRSELKANWTSSKKNCFLSRSNGIKYIEQIIQELSQGTATPNDMHLTNHLPSSSKMKSVKSEKQPLNRYPGQHAPYIPRFAKSIGRASCVGNQFSDQDWDEEKGKESNPLHQEAQITASKDNVHLLSQIVRKNSRDALVADDVDAAKDMDIVAADIRDSPRNEKEVIYPDNDVVDPAKVKQESEEVKALESSATKVIRKDTENVKSVSEQHEVSGNKLLDESNDLTNPKEVFENKQTDENAINGCVKGEEMVNIQDQATSCNNESITNEARPSEVTGKDPRPDDSKSVNDEKPANDYIQEVIDKPTPCELNVDDSTKTDDYEDYPEEIMETNDDSLQCNTVTNEGIIEDDNDEEQIVNVVRKGSMHALLEKIELMFVNEDAVTETQTANAKDFLKKMKKNYARSLSSKDDENNGNGKVVDNDNDGNSRDVNSSEFNESLLSEFSDDVSCNYSFSESVDKSQCLDSNGFDMNVSPVNYDINGQHPSDEINEKSDDTTGEFSDQVSGEDIAKEKRKKPDRQLYKPGKSKSLEPDSNVDKKPKETVLNDDKSPSIMGKKQNPKSKNKKKKSGNRKTSTGSLNSNEEKKQSIRILKRTDPDAVKLKAFEAGFG